MVQLNVVSIRGMENHRYRLCEKKNPDHDNSPADTINGMMYIQK